MPGDGRRWATPDTVRAKVRRRGGDGGVILRLVAASAADPDARRSLSAAFAVASSRASRAEL